MNSKKVGFRLDSRLAGYWSIFYRSIGMDSQLSFSLSGTAKSGLLNLVNRRIESLAGERRFLPTFLCCCKKVWSDGRDAVRKTQWIAVCEAHALARAAHNLSGRRPYNERSECLVSPAHAFIFKRKKRPCWPLFLIFLILLTHTLQKRPCAPLRVVHKFLFSLIRIRPFAEINFNRCTHDL